MSYLDFMMYEALYHNKTYDSEFIEPFPNLMAYLKRFEDLETIKAYIASNNFISKPCFSPKANSI